MTYKRYTSCFLYPAGGKPYNTNDRTAFIVGRLIGTAAIAGVAALVGLLAGPIGAIIAGTIGLLAGLTALIDKAADEWLHHRLICLDKDNPKCAVGTVSYSPKSSELLDFDNDQYFDVLLMPHPAVPEGEGGALVPANRYKLNTNDNTSDGPVVDGFRQFVNKFPANDLFTDGFQGQALLGKHPVLAADLGYVPVADNESSQHRVTLHCEAEGDFWARIKAWSPALAVLLTTALVVTTAAAGGGAAAGAAIGCAILSFFFGPAGCAIGAALGGLIGGAVGGAAGGAASYFGAIEPILKAIANANPGDVEDANVGDRSLGPIRMGDRVVVLGEHIYDGYHEGWHELHPLMAVVKIGASNGPSLGMPTTDHYLSWNPGFTGQPPPPPPGELVQLTADDMQQGLASGAFRTRCANLLRTWCTMLNDAFSGPTRQKQQGLEERWTIHPMVDGCLPKETVQPPIH